MQEVLYVENGHSRTVVLNRPKKLNALNLSMIRDMDPALRVCARSPLHRLTKAALGV